jgi:hypothetical protein
MKKLQIAVVLMFVLVFSVGAFAQEPKPFHNGPVWDIGFIHAKAGMEDRYLRYIAQEWKAEQEALKKAGIVLDYKVITTEAHGPSDFNVILMTQFKDLASLEANQEKAEQIALQLAGGNQKMESGYVDRSSYREVVGSRLGQEIILAPKGASK